MRVLMVMMAEIRTNELVTKKTHRIIEQIERTKCRNKTVDEVEYETHRRIHDVDVLQWKTTNLQTAHSIRIHAFDKAVHTLTHFAFM